MTFAYVCWWLVVMFGVDVGVCIVDMHHTMRLKPPKIRLWCGGAGVPFVRQLKPLLAEEPTATSKHIFSVAHAVQVSLREPVREKLALFAFFFWCSALCESATMMTGKQNASNSLQPRWCSLYVYVHVYVCETERGTETETETETETDGAPSQSCPFDPIEDSSLLWRRWRPFCTSAETHMFRRAHSKLKQHSPAKVNLASPLPKRGPVSKKPRVLRFFGFFAFEPKKGNLLTSVPRRALHFHQTIVYIYL